MARSQLASARGDISQLRSQLSNAQFSQATATAVRIDKASARAHALTTGPAWSTLAALPAGGEPFRTVRAITTQTHRLSSRALPGLVAAARQLDPASLRTEDGRIRVGRLAALVPALDSARTTLDDATQAVRASPADTWLNQVDDARSSFITELSDLDRTVQSADLAASIAPHMLGQDGTQRYFVAFENDAEARGTGGIPGAFAILDATDGQIRFERFEPDTYLYVQPTHLRFGADYRQLLAGARPTSFYLNSNITPQFSYAAQTWMAMWHARTGERLDGAVALDPTAISYLLQVTGPASLPDGGSVSAGNIVALTQSTVYAKFPKLRQNTARKRYLLRLAQAVGAKVVSGSGVDAAALLRAAGEAADQRRLLVYSADPAVEKKLEQTPLSGAIPRTSRPYIGLAVVNVGGNKLDYYLHRQLTWHSSGCGARRRVTVTARLTNAAPAHGLSPYVTERNDFPGHPTKPGDNRLAVYYYATDGARLDGLDIDGRPATPSSGSLEGHPVFVADVEMPQGRTRDVTFELSEPATSGAPIILRQPLVHPIDVTVNRAGCH